MRTMITTAALAGLIGLPAPIQAAPVVPHELAVSTPAITLVRQRCGIGMKRGASAWQDKQGAWHGGCVPKHKMTDQSGFSAATSRGGGNANELNAQELARIQGAAPPAPPTR